VLAARFRSVDGGIGRHVYSRVSSEPWMWMIANFGRAPFRLNASMAKMPHASVPSA
jgi:hypothetical protein